MIGLMSRWFAAPAGLPLEGGYFYLCPNCFQELIEPHLEELLDLLREHQPAPKSAAQPPEGAGGPEAPAAAASPAVTPSTTPPEGASGTKAPANGRPKRASAPKEPPPVVPDTPAPDTPAAPGA